VLHRDGLDADREGGIPRPNQLESPPRAPGEEEKAGVEGKLSSARSNESLSNQGGETSDAKGVTKDVPDFGDVTKEPPRGGEWGRRMGAKLVRA